MSDLEDSGSENEGSTTEKSNASGSENESESVSSNSWRKGIMSSSEYSFFKVKPLQTRYDEGL